MRNAKRTWLWTAARCAAGFALGLAWNAGALGIALSPVLVLLWRSAKSRYEVAVLILAYHLAAALPSLLATAHVGYADLSVLELAGMALCAAAAMSVLWSACWSSSCHASTAATLLRVSIVLALAALPGWGVLGVQSPLTAAGLWLPSTGWCGLVAVVLCVAWVPLRVPALALTGLVIVCASQGLRARAQAARSDLKVIWARDTALPVSPAPHDYFAQSQVALAALDQLSAQQEAPIVLLPEGVGGLWTEEMRALWRRAMTARAVRSAVLLGATLPVETVLGERYDNALMVLDGDQEQHVLQRFPVPGVMWRPWRDRGAFRAHWWDAGIVEVRGHRLGVLLCYEQMLVFPVLMSIAHGAEQLVGLANVRPFDAPSLMRWQSAALESWGALFELPIYGAFNL